MTPCHVCGPASLLFWGILAVGEIKLACQSSLGLSFSAKLTSGSRLGWAGLQLWQTGLFVWGDNAVKMLWSDSWKDKHLEKGRHTESICFHLEEYLFPPCSEQVGNEANWQRLEWNRRWEMSLMNGRYRYVARGDGSRLKLTQVWIYNSCRKDGRSEYSLPPPTPTHLSIQWHTQMLNRCGGHYTSGWHQTAPTFAAISYALGSNCRPSHTHLVRLTLCRLPSNHALYTTNLPKMHTLFSNLNFSNVIIPPDFSG